MISSEPPAVELRHLERAMFAARWVKVAARRVGLADTPLAVGVLETGEGLPLLLVHGSGMSAPIWAPRSLARGPAVDAKRKRWLPQVRRTGGCRRADSDACAVRLC
jgi:pimeloyl-ACP methyl ester carboxylesterase